MIGTCDEAEDSIDKLNDYCLRNVFTKLPFRDRIRNERVCKRWKYISEEGFPDVKKMILIYRNYFLKIEIQRNGKVDTVQLSFANCRSDYHSQIVEKFLARVGRFLNYFSIDWSQSLYFGEGPPLYAKVIAKQCYNIKTLVLAKCYPFSCDEFKCIFSTCKKLEHLKISLSNEESMRELSDAWSHLPKDGIKTFELSPNSRSGLPCTVTEVLQDFSNLQTLIFRHTTFSLGSLTTMTNNPAVRKIVFDRCTFLNHAMLAITGFKNLVELVLLHPKYSSFNISPNLMKAVETNMMPALKRIEWNNYFGDYSDFFILFIKNADNLRILDIVCIYETAKGLVDIARGIVKTRTNNVVLKIKFHHIRKEKKKVNFSEDELPLLKIINK